jgi:hypothetical protein
MLGRLPGLVTVVLFSQAGCEFCEEARENYLKALVATHQTDLVIAEMQIDSSLIVRDWKGITVSQIDFCRANQVRFAPTLMFFDSNGATLARPIVGLSKDFFGAYLDARIATARKTVRARGSVTPSQEVPA